jgi:hypothetical protein
METAIEAIAIPILCEAERARAGLPLIGTATVNDLRHYDDAMRSMNEEVDGGSRRRQTMKRGLAGDVWKGEVVS